MASIKIKWSSYENLSIRDCASECGFNLRTLDLSMLKEEQSKWIVETVAKYILEFLEESWDETYRRIPFKKASNCVYVISLGGSICIDYKRGQSQVIYIGEGSLRNRIKSHLKNWIMNFSESLQDMCLTFYMAKVAVKNSQKPHKEVEADFIEKFIGRFGEKPILNKNRGANHNKDHEYNRASLKPLYKKQGMSYGWKISAMPKNDWFREIDG